jgi:hypothetical protein
MRWLVAASPARMACPSPSAARFRQDRLDEFFFATGRGRIAHHQPGECRVRSEIDAAHALFDRRGWLADPAAFHHAPPPLVRRQRDARLAH